MSSETLLCAPFGNLLVRPQSHPLASESGEKVVECSVVGLEG